jgi:hypothetical protein
MVGEGSTIEVGSIKGWEECVGSAVAVSFGNKFGSNDLAKTTPEIHKRHTTKRVIAMRSHEMRLLGVDGVDAVGVVGSGFKGGFGVSTGSLRASNFSL